MIPPLEQQIRIKLQKSLTSPAIIAARKAGMSQSPEIQAELIRTGEASKFAIVTERTGAEVFTAGLRVGITPLVFVLLKKDGTPRTVEVRMDGYMTR